MCVVACYLVHSDQPAAIQPPKRTGLPLLVGQRTRKWGCGHLCQSPVNAGNQELMFPEVRRLLVLSWALTLVPKQGTPTLNIRFRAATRVDAGFTRGRDQSPGQSQAPPPTRPWTRLPMDSPQERAEGSPQRSSRGARPSPRGQTNLSLGSPSPSCAPQPFPAGPALPVRPIPASCPVCWQGTTRPPPPTPCHSPRFLAAFCFNIYLLFSCCLMFLCLFISAPPNPAPAAAWSCS